jgi:predicted nucleic acid-binding protein
MGAFTVQENKQMTRGYMVDTNIFDAICKAHLQFTFLHDRLLYATHIQRDELANCQNVELRARLLTAFKKVAAEQVPTPAAIFDVSRWGEAKWGRRDQNHFLQEFASRIQAADKRVRKRPKELMKNALRDALIALTARENGLVLLTGDHSLYEVAQQYQVDCEIVDWDRSPLKPT